MPIPRMYVNRAVVGSMRNRFLQSKLACFHEDQVNGGSVSEFCTPRILELITSKFKSKFPGLVGGIKVYFICNPAFGSKYVSLLFVPTKPAIVTGGHKLFQDLDCYVDLRTLMNLVDPEREFGEAELTKQDAADFHNIFRNTVLVKLNNTLPHSNHSDTRSIAYDLDEWDEFLAEVMLHQVPALKIYLAASTNEQLSLIYLMQRMTSTKLVDYYLEETPDFESRFKGKTDLFSFDTGNPCPPGSGLIQDRCPGSNLEP